MSGSNIIKMSSAGGSKNAAPDLQKRLDMAAKIKTAQSIIKQEVDTMTRLIDKLCEDTKDLTLFSESALAWREIIVEKTIKTVLIPMINGQNSSPIIDQSSFDTLRKEIFRKVIEKNKL